MRVGGYCGQLGIGGLLPDFLSKYSHYSNENAKIGKVKYQIVDCNANVIVINHDVSFFFFLKVAYFLFKIW